MNKASINILKLLRKFCSKKNNVFYVEGGIENNPDYISRILAEELNRDKPSMIARFGSTELLTITNYIGVHVHGKNLYKYIRGEGLPWWWEQSTLKQMMNWSGFFPPTQEKIERFCELMIDIIPEVDILGSWLENENIFKNELAETKKVGLLGLDPFWAKLPWTLSLEGKKVLVVHPFEKTIEAQYKKRELIFENNLLPQFELKTIKAVQSLGGINTEFEDWFDALNYMKEEISKCDFDICLIGAGAYGFPLAAHVKSIGKKGFHIGGSLQLLFGIRGSRWENNYNDQYDYKGLVNKYWVKPLESETPINATAVEGGCYW